MKMRIGAGADAFTPQAMDTAKTPTRMTGARILFSQFNLFPHYATTSYVSQRVDKICYKFPNM